MEQDQDQCLHNSAGSSSLVFNQIQVLHDEILFLKTMLKDVLVSKNHAQANNHADGQDEIVDDALENGDPIDQAFAVHLVLDKILGYLPASDLKTCRSVSHNWNSNATKILLKKKLCEITLRVVDSTTHLVKRNGKNSPDDSCADLRELSELITNPKFGGGRLMTASARQNHLPWSFPSCCFTFWYNTVSNEVIRLFVEKCGHIIKNFCLQVDDGTCENPEDADGELRRLADFKKMLTHHLPNLEKLTLENFPATWYDANDLGQLFPEPLENRAVLGKLKTLNLRSLPPTKILMDIIAAAPSLSSIVMKVVCNSDILQQLAERNKIHLVKDIRLKIFPNDLSSYENFLEAHENKLRLQKLSICLEDSANVDFNYWARGFALIAKFLRSNSESLLKLHTDRFGCWPGFQIPVLPKLKVLEVTSITAQKNDSYNHYLSQLFPTNIKLSKLFPVLETILLTMRAGADWKKKIGATSYDKLLSVRRAFIATVPARFVVKFCKMFPNINTAYVETIGDFRMAARALWTLKNLVDLSIGLELTRQANNRHPALDAGFTGFSDETCRQLYVSSRDVDIHAVNSLRENVSILDLKNLRRLDVFFLEDDTDYEGLTYPLISHVTGLFAFKMCPQLLVRFTYDAHFTVFELKWLKMAISPILPYVTEFGTEGCQFWS